MRILQTKYFLFLILMITLSMDVLGQCSMCRAIAESNQQGGGAIATGLNNGILYLMMFPYLLIGGVGYLWYRHKKAVK
ncbi:MAG: hypothetical protein LPK80_08250 [Bacteroidota bacterium]|nr:hypothetical protein [Bacteroidota bacterium]MDX5428929.1 hypothetical protein [Bacteroidota bacterium]MDX5448000.1 hypothetical protein [Bacteroidota bacterium]MDX5506609.1 hypothetical protein [Bacteroidota bacterium]